MRGFRFLLLVSVVVLGFGPATAQDLFVNKYKRTDSDAKPSLYVTRGQYQERGETQVASRNDFRKSRTPDKLALARDAKNVADKIDVFYAWRNADRKPGTQEEILSYADSKRAVIEGAIMMRKKDLIARLESDDHDSAMREVRSAASVHRDSRGQSDAYAGRSTNTTSRTTITKPQIYRSGDSPNTGVYKNYR